MRDYALESTFDVKFTSRRFTTGAPFALASGVISAYPDNSTTQLTAGITLSADFDGVTGLNNIRVVATAANGYAAGSNYALVITTGTVDSVSVVGEVVAEFSLEAQSSLRPTVALRKLDVSSTGEAGVDWANVGSPTTTLALTGTTIATTQKVDVETIKTNAVVNGGTITFPTTATLASTTNITAGTITTTTNLTNAATSGDLTATMKASVNTEVVDTLNVDTYAEPGQETPPATTTLTKKIGYLYKFLRNRKTQTATLLSVFADDATTVDQKSTVSDNGTTLDSGEIATGP